MMAIPLRRPGSAKKDRACVDVSKILVNHKFQGCVLSRLSYFDIFFLDILCMHSLYLTLLTLLLAEAEQVDRQAAEAEQP